MHEIKLSVTAAAYEHLMFLLKNLNTNEVNIVEDNLVQQNDGTSSDTQEALQAWQDYQETGLHITWQEAQTWMQSWGTDDVQAAPLCHK